MMGIWDVLNDPQAGAPRYNSSTGELNLEDVAVNGSHFRVKLLDKGGLQFTVIDYLSLPIPVENAPTLYDAGTGLVIIPKVVAAGKAYQVTLQGKANGVFGIQQASLL
jgi:hypothetical protein